jgi:exosortase
VETNVAIPNRQPKRAFAAAVLVLGGLVAWVYWPTLQLLVQTWTSDPQYSHGYLVPVFAVFLLWYRRSRADFANWHVSWWGVALLAAAGLIRMAGGFLSFDWLDAMALLPCLAGLALLLGGRPALAWSWPAIAFLAFMVPLPYRLAHSLSGPLQALATQMSGYLMQMLGLPAFVEGNTILLDGHRIAVVEACSGLSMLITFGALATAFAILVRRPMLDRVLFVLSAIPIAIVANVCRISATGVAMHTAGPELADKIFHDLAGWLMMPLAIGLLALEMKLLDVLLVAPAPSRVRPPIPGVAAGQTAPPAPPARGAQRQRQSVTASVPPRT